VPELAALENEQLHAPWEVKPLILQLKGVRLGETYPNPMVNHAQAKEEALAALATLKQEPEA
jgi:deoxyribodipyrimidine photo-lyase